MANFNNAKYIETAIKSVISQTYPFWELIIVDDCSNDESLRIIEQFLKDNRIKLIQHQRNQGYGGALKTAALNASNNIFGILDPDDKLHKNALEKMAETYQKFPDYGLIYSTMWICDSNLENCQIDKTLGPIIPEKTSIFKQKISHFKTFRKEAYLKTSGFDPNQKKTVDKDIIYKLEEVCTFKFIDETLYYYRCHPEGISQGKNAYFSRLSHYIVKCKTYQRRINTNLPNYQLKNLYLEYFVITFYSLIQFIFKVLKFMKIKLIIKYLARKFTIIRFIIQNNRLINAVLFKI